MKPAGKAAMMIDMAIITDESMAPLDAVMKKKGNHGSKSHIRE